MGGGLMQLVAYGSQDVYLTGNPQITFWKVVYRRHTNFALESVVQTFNGNVTHGSNVVATISRNGDLIHKCYLEVTPNAITPETGAFTVDDFIDSVELEIGGQQIDKQTGKWMDVWNKLSLDESKRNGWNAMMTGTKAVAASGTGDDATDAKAVEKVFIPLEFFFCTNPGLALPLIALQYHEVRMKFKLGARVAEANLWVDYVYLDTDERRKMAQSSHEFLITQLQSQDYNGTNQRLNFNHPVKELVWEHDPKALGTVGTATGECKITLNGHERAAPRDWKYFNKVQPFQHHTSVPSDTTIGVYSFALKPEESQPSGSCNFSRIDNAQISLGNCTEATVYATNWNVLRIMSGMGGLAYSN